MEPAGDTSFSSLPDNTPGVDLEIQADVHHRTMSFDSDAAPDTPDPTHRDQPLANGNHPVVNGETHCSNRSLTRILEENCNSLSSKNGEPIANGQHNNDLSNSHSKDSVKGNGPSYVVDSSLNEIHVDNSR